MTRYDIYTDNLEFRGTAPFPPMSGDEILDTHLSCDDRITSNSLDPHLESSHASRDEALAAFNSFSDYGRTKAETSGGIHYLRGELAWVEEVEVDDDGELICSCGIIASSVEPFPGYADTMEMMVSDWLFDHQEEMADLTLDGDPYYDEERDAWVQDAHDDRTTYVLIDCGGSIDIHYLGTL